MSARSPAAARLSENGPSRSRYSIADSAVRRIAGVKYLADSSARSSDIGAQCASGTPKRSLCSAEAQMRSGTLSTRLISRR